ncbi:hypothetical protein BP6252_06581 [Coleophoma cylindrospora]|uniref:Heterokaryon incompatibility domain-containing protein n=1 Tax=Coleophoma cylindrospora TaxID=1849047 RepID=A0A3D8RN16_9HELO|nr:hypothetical protein BP6252_06581 [Coleophoma cylindrospora]
MPNMQPTNVHSCNHCSKIHLDVDLDDIKAHRWDRKPKTLIPAGLTMEEVCLAASDECEFAKYLLSFSGIQRAQDRNDLGLTVEFEIKFFRPEDMPRLRFSKFRFTRPDSTYSRSGVGSTEEDCDLVAFAEWDDVACTIVDQRIINHDVSSRQTFDKARWWLEQCNEKHTECGRPPSSFMPSRLIAIDRKHDQWIMRLVSTAGTPTKAYIALSYCWGGDQPIKSTLDTISRWEKSIPFEQLPKTLQDAIIVTYELGERFVWIDVLCIIQDDESSKSIEISQMPLVYNEAYLTIAAASSSRVQDGFLTEKTMETHFKFSVSIKGKGDGFLHLGKFPNINQPLSTRAWAFQERALSSRSLEYCTSQLRWLCKHTTDLYSDATFDGVGELLNYVDGHGAVFTASFGSNTSITHETLNLDFLKGVGKGIDKIKEWEDRKLALRYWYPLVNHFSQRDLTWHTDKLPAISAIAQRFKDALGLQYYSAGIWDEDLVQGLLWKVADESSKRAHAPELSLTASKDYTPSWSWAKSIYEVKFLSEYKKGCERETLSEAKGEMSCAYSEPLFKEAPMGAVIFGSCSIWGHLTPVKRYKDYPFLRVAEAPNTLLLRISFDEKLQEEDFDRPLYLLELRRFTEFAICNCGIVLTPRTTTEKKNDNESDWSDVSDSETTSNDDSAVLNSQSCNDSKHGITTLSDSSNNSMSSSDQEPVYLR